MSSFGKIFKEVELNSLLESESSDLIKEAVNCGVMCLRGEEQSIASLSNLGRRFGELKKQVLRDHRVDGFPGVSKISNKHRDTLGDGSKINLGSHWHTDDSYLEYPASFTLLNAKIIPGEGKGSTLFADTKAAWESLHNDIKEKIEGLKAVHKYQSRRCVSQVPKRTKEEESETNDVIHPLVRIHPVSGEKALYINPNRIDHIVGLTFLEGDKILDELIHHVTKPIFLYKHSWKIGDILIWDNRRTLHKVEVDFGNQPREMIRLLISGTKPV